MAEFQSVYGELGMSEFGSKLTSSEEDTPHEIVQPRHGKTQRRVDKATSMLHGHDLSVLVGSTSRALEGHSYLHKPAVYRKERRHFAYFLHEDPNTYT